jgi:hypothetical protein
MVWVAALADQNQLATLVFHRGSRAGHVEAADDLAAADDVTRVVMLPLAEAPATPVDANDVHSIEKGWLEVWPGQLIGAGPSGILLLSEVTARDEPDVANRPVRWLQWMKRRVKKDGVVNGVTGRNVVFGGESFYHDIRFSRGAETLHQGGAVWKQFVEGNAVFEPGRSESDPTTG